MRLVAPVILVLVLLTSAAHGQQIHRDGFEGPQIKWVKGKADAGFREQKHELSTQTAHGGQQAEYLQINSDHASSVFYAYPVARANLEEDTTVSVWVRANRPGLQIAARVVLPKEREPSNLDQPMTTVLRGDSYQIAGRWQRLGLRGPMKIAKQQQQLLRAELNRDVNFDGAYVDQILLNVNAGPGVTEVWIDDLEAGPMSGTFSAPLARRTEPTPKAPTAETGKGAKPSPVLAQPGPSLAPQAPNLLKPSNPLKPEALAKGTPFSRDRQAVVELNQDQLTVNRRPFLVRGLRYNSAPLKSLKEAGFNTLWLDFNAPSETYEEAVRQGFWLAPVLPVLEKGNSPQAIALGQKVARFPFEDAVVFWDLGAGLSAERADAVGQAAQMVRSSDRYQYQGRPLAADVWDGFTAYSRSLDMIGVHRWPLMTSLELRQYYDWLTQRRQLARPGTYLWTWVQAQTPDWYSALLASQSPGQIAGEMPLAPQSEQIRLLTYLALAAGYRGIGFWPDRSFGTGDQGRERLLTMALLNQELEMLEPILASAGPPTWINTKLPEIKAAVFRFDDGVLVLPIWMGKGGQFVPGQLAKTNLELIIPQTPQNAQVWELTPAEFRALKRERTTGGIKVIIPEFGLTTALIFTSDVNKVDGGLIGRLQQAAVKNRKQVAEWSCELGALELKRVEQVNTQLEQLGQKQPDGQALLNNARQRLEKARGHLKRGTSTDYREAFAEGERALRPLRILMRAHWEKAVRDLDNLVASPFVLSYYTLPQHWRMMQQVQSAKAGDNLLPNGDFEMADESPYEWALQQVTLDNVELLADRVAENPKTGTQCLKLQVKAQNPAAKPAALERTYLAMSAPPVKAAPGSLVRISGWVRIPEPGIHASVDGVLFFDSVGGEPLAVRMTEATRWKQFTFYRTVPSTGLVSVTAALTGIGSAYFDDIRIEPLTVQPGATAATPKSMLESLNPLKLVNRPRSKESK